MKYKVGVTAAIKENDEFVIEADSEWDASKLALLQMEHSIGDAIQSDYPKYSIDYIEPMERED